MIPFRLEIVGGPYDGVRGLTMALTSAESLAEWIWLGMCRGDGLCAIPECPGVRHPAFWLPREDGDQPPSALRYELRDQDDVRQVGTYAVGGVRPVQTAVAGDELPMVEQENPLVPAGRVVIDAVEIPEPRVRCGELKVQQVDDEWAARVIRVPRRDAPARLAFLKLSAGGATLPAMLLRWLRELRRRARLWPLREPIGCLSNREIDRRLR